MRRRPRTGPVGRVPPKAVFGTFITLAFVVPDVALSAAVDLDQVRNGSASSPNDPGVWVNGNLNASQAHYIEGWSTSYRAIMTDLPVGTPITLTLGYDIKHSDTHALDYLTHYDRLEPHSTIFGHSSETIDPLIGSGVDPSAPMSTFPLPAPSSAGSPSAGMPTDSFLALPVAERVMTMWNGTIEDISYAVEGSLAAAQDETQISVTFTPSNPTVVLAWGGHIASRLDWGFDGDTPRSAAGISGSPYHMRIIDWSLGNLGQQDRSLSAAAVFPPPTCSISGPVDLCESGTADYSVSTDYAGAMFQWILVSNTAGATFIGSTTDSSVSIDVGTAGSYELEVTVTAATGTTTCSTVAVVNPAATVSAGPDQAICSDPSPVIQLQGSFGGGATSALWTTSGTGAFGDPSDPLTTYTPSTADIQSGTVTLTLTTDDPVGPCGPLSDTLMLEISPVAIVDAGADQAVCSDPIPVIALAGAFGGGATSAAWTTSGTGTFGDASNPVTTYIPSSADILAGSVTLTLTTDDPLGPCDAASDGLQLDINPAATADAGPDLAVCSDPPPVVQLAGSFEGGAASVTWTTSGSGTFGDASNPVTTYTPSPDDIASGQVTLTLTTNDPEGDCGAASDDTILSISPAALVDAGEDQAVCSVPSPVIQLAGSIGGGATSATWTSSGTGTFGDASDPLTTYTPSPDDITAGSVTLTLTSDDPSGPCEAASDTMALTIGPAATVDAGPDQSACASPPPVIQLAGSFGGSATGVTWTTDGSGTFADPTSPVTTYSPSSDDLASGTVELTLTTDDPEGPCDAARDEMIVTVDPSPVCFLPIPDPLPFCGSVDNVLQGPPGMTSYVWQVTGNAQLQSGQGTESITYSVGPTLGAITISLAVTDAKGCQNSCEVTFWCAIEGSVLCGFTQGFYGNAGGHFNQIGTLQLIRDLLTTPLVVGQAGTSLSIPHGSASCIIERLPAGVTPKTLPAGFGDQTIYPDSCQTDPPLGLDSNGKWENILLGQSVALPLNIRVSPALEDVRICAEFRTVKALPGPDGILGTADDLPSGDPADLEVWTIPQSVLDALDSSPTVGDLLALAYSALAGAEPQALLPAINQAVTTINEAFDQCRFFVDDCSPGVLGEYAPAPDDHGRQRGGQQQVQGEGNQDADGSLELPSAFALYGSRPNPTHDESHIGFDLPAASHVLLEIYDITGRRVRTVERGMRPAGRHTIIWNTRDESGQRVAAGIYFYRLTAGHFHQLRKMIVLR